MSGRKSRDKGARGEREFAAKLRELGFDAERGAQRSGSPDSPDVKSSLKWAHFEVKRRESLSLYPAMQQAVEECGDKVPVVAHRRNRKEWLVIMHLEDFAKLADGSLPERET